MPTGSARVDVTFFCPYTGGFTTQSNFVIVPTNEAMIERLTEMWRNDGSTRPSRDPTMTRGIQRLPIVDLSAGHWFTLIPFPAHLLLWIPLRLSCCLMLFTVTRLRSL